MRRSQSTSPAAASSSSRRSVSRSTPSRGSSTRGPAGGLVAAAPMRRPPSSGVAACGDGVSVSRRLSTIYDMLAVTGPPDPVTIDGPRPARPADLPEVIALVDAAMRAGTDQTLLTDYPLVYDPANLHNVRVLRVDGELASVVPVLPRDAVVAGRLIRIGIISPT